MPSNAPTQPEQIALPRRSRSPKVQQPRSGVRKDNPAPPRARAAAPQPASPQKDLRSRHLPPPIPRSHKPTKLKQKSVQLVLWVKPVVKAEVQRIADQEGLSL